MIPRDPSNPAVASRSKPDRLNSTLAVTTRVSTSWPSPAWHWLALALPVLVFALVWQAYAINIPKWDDHALRAFLFYSEGEPTLRGKIYQLFRQHNEHRIVYDRIITALDYALFGKLNYVHLMLVGNLSLVGLLAVCIAVLRRAGRAVVYALPVALLLFNLSQWENMFWGMAALQNFSVVLWMIAAFYFLSYTNHWKLALASAVLATLTSGNGLIVWPIGFLLLILRPTVYYSAPQRLISRPLIGWLAGAVVVVGLYFTGFEKPGDIAYVRPGPIDLLKGWFAVIGAAAEVLPFGSPLHNGILLGAGLVVVTMAVVGWSVFINWQAITQLFQHLLNRTGSGTQAIALPALPLFFIACVMFILGTAAVVAWARTGFGADLLITSRYKMYSLTLLALLYVYAVSSLNERLSGWGLMVSLGGGLVFAGLSYVSFLDETIWWRHWLTTNQFNWTHSTNRPNATLDSVSQRYTQLAPAFYDVALPIIYGSPTQRPVALSITKTPGGFAIQNQTIPATGLGDAGNYLVARSTKRTYLFPVWQNQQSIRKARFMPTGVFTTGFRSTVLSSELDAGTYQLFVLMVSDRNSAMIYPTNQTMVSAGAPMNTTTKNW